MAFLWITLLKEAATINYGFLFVERTFAKLVPEHKYSSIAAFSGYYQLYVACYGPQRSTDTCYVGTVGRVMTANQDS